MRKVYRCTGITLFLEICYVVISLLSFGAALLYMIVKEWLQAAIFGVSFCIFLVIFIYYVAIKAFTPIYVTEEKIRQGKTEYAWEDIKITAVPLYARYVVCYILLLRDEYFYDIRTCKKEIKKGLCAIMTPQALKILLPNYKRKVLVLDRYGDEDIPRAYKKVNNMIREHNATH